MSDTPPSTNPSRAAALSRRHWANPIEIKPGVFSVMEGAGPRAQVRDFAVVRLDPKYGWQSIGRVSRPRYGRVELKAWANQHYWNIVYPEGKAPDLIEMFIEIAKEHA